MTPISTHQRQLLTLPSVILSQAPKAMHCAVNSQCSVYYVRLTIEGFPVASVRCIATARGDVLVGRNVLNRFFITLDGRRQTFALSE